MKFIKPLNEKKPKDAPDFHHSDAPDAEGRFRDLGIKDLAAWLIKTRKKDVKKISGSLTQQVVFNRNDDPEYAEKMEKVRKEVYKQLGRQDLIDKMDESVDEAINEKKQLPKEITKHKDIPSWARYVAQQSDGEWTWYEETPTMIRFRSGGGAWKQDGNQTYTGVKTDGKDWDKIPTYYYVKGGKITEMYLKESVALSSGSKIVKQFRKELGSQQCNIYDKRDNCGPAASDFVMWTELNPSVMRQYGIKDLKIIRGFFKGDIPVSAKRDFTREMKKEFLKDGGNWNSDKERLEWISNSKYAEQWKYIPHYWVEDSKGKIYDPVGQQQFIDAGYSKDLNSDRYTLSDDVQETFFNGKVKGEQSRLNEEDSYNDYPATAKKNAQIAIDWKEKYGRDEVPAGTPVGWARAHQLAKGEKISADTVKRMSAFNRHRKNSSIAPEHKDTPWKDNGYVAWLIWGGDEGVDWAIEKSKEIDAMKESKQMKYIKPLNERAKHTSTDFSEPGNDGDIYFSKREGDAVGVRLGDKLQMIYVFQEEPKLGRIQKTDKRWENMGPASEKLLIDLRGREEGKILFDFVSTLEESVDEVRRSMVSGTSGRTVSSLEYRKYELKKDVEDAKIGDFINVTLPKGTIIYNLPGGVFADHFALKQRYASRSSRGPQYFDKPTFKGMQIISKHDTLTAIENNSKVLESVNERTSIKKGDYVLYKGNGTKWVKSEVMQVIPSAKKLHIDWNDEYIEVHVKEIKPVKESVNESYWSHYEYDKWTKENGKPKYPKWVKTTLKEIVKGGFMEDVYDSEHMYMVLWLGSLENKRRSEMYAYDNKGEKEFGKVGYSMYKRFYNDLTGYNMFFMQGAMYALEVSKQIQDRIANGEPVEPAYYMMKEYFNNFGMDTKRSRVFNTAYEKLEKWMKDNQIETL